MGVRVKVEETRYLGGRPTTITRHQAITASPSKHDFTPYNCGPLPAFRSRSKLRVIDSRPTRTRNSPAVVKFLLTNSKASTYPHCSIFHEVRECGVELSNFPPLACLARGQEIGSDGENFGHLNSTYLTITERNASWDLQRTPRRAHDSRVKAILLTGAGNETLERGLSTAAVGNSFSGEPRATQKASRPNVSSSPVADI